jgi:hypothetical protein
MHDSAYTSKQNTLQIYLINYIFLLEELWLLFFVLTIPKIARNLYLCCAIDANLMKI